MKAQSAKQHSLAHVIAGAAQRRPALTLGLLAAAAGTVTAGVLPPLALERFVNGLTAGQASVGIAVFYFALLALADLFEATKEYLVTCFGEHITHAVRSAIADRLSALDAGYYTAHEPGETASLLVNDVNAVESLFTGGVIGMAIDACRVISVIAVIFTRSPGLGILTLLATPPLFALTMRFQRGTRRAQRTHRAAIARANQQIPETLHNARTIRTLHCEAFMRQRYAREIDRSFEAQERSNFYDAVYSPIIIFTGAVITAVMMTCSVRGGAAAQLFGMSAGTAVAVIAYVGKIFDPLESIGMEITTIQSAAAGAERISAFLGTPCTAAAAGSPAGRPEDAPCAPTGPAVALRDVCFAYAEGEDVLHGFSLDVAEGERVTVAGRTGAGKSTLFRLILGLYRPRSGSVYVLGRTPEQIPPSERRHVFGYVEQQFRPVPGTVADQVTLGDTSITPAAAEDALRLTGLWPLVEGLPQGPDTPFDAAGFSQGQLQLLGIARAVCGGPRILLLDEITASLDSATEAQVLSALRAAGADRTVLSISHRLYETDPGRLVQL